MSFLENEGCKREMSSKKDQIPGRIGVRDRQQGIVAGEKEKLRNEIPRAPARKSIGLTKGAKTNKSRKRKADGERKKRNGKTHSCPNLMLCTKTPSKACWNSFNKTLTSKGDV